VHNKHCDPGLNEFLEFLSNLLLGKWRHGQEEINDFSGSEWWLQRQKTGHSGFIIGAIDELDGACM
jgi:hypothetical protein